MGVLWLLVKVLATIVFVNRYLGGFVMRLLRGAKWDETDDHFEPTVTVVMPLFNEGASIQEALRTVLASDYPAEKLRIVVIDDCSSDNSFELASELTAGSGGTLVVRRNKHNVGKRKSIIAAVREADSEIIVSIDSDVIVDPDAIRQLVRRFAQPQIAAVGGWVDIRNKHDNWLTRMQTVKYWYAYYAMRNIEWGLKRMLCLSGCLTAYRRSVLLELESVLAGRALMGMPIKYGEDRFLTRQIVKAGYLTTITLAARCRTFVPRTLGVYFSQQLRWRRSNLIDYAGGLTHIWRLNPLIAINYFAMFVVMIGYPIAVVRALGANVFFPAIVGHLHVLLLFGLYYRWKVRKWPPEDRVGVLSFLPQSLVMPITYALLTPLALFTLDSTNWETRGSPARARGDGDAGRAALAPGTPTARGSEPDPENERGSRSSLLGGGD